MCKLLVIVDYLHVFRTRIGPSKYDPPLIVDADRVLARQVALERFKAVAGRRAQGLEKVGGVHHDQFSAGYLGEICREPFRGRPALKDLFGEFPPETPYHGQYVSHRDTYCNALVSHRDTKGDRGDGCSHSNPAAGFRPRMSVSLMRAAACFAWSARADCRSR